MANTDEDDQQRLADANADIERARRINEFLNLQVWKKDLEPMLAAIQAETQEALMWVAQELDAATTAMRDAGLKGKYRAVAEIGKRILDMRQAGVESAKYVERLKKKAEVI